MIATIITSSQSHLRRVSTDLDKSKFLLESNNFELTVKYFSDVGTSRGH